jgi:multisubunit Na+/H+ antiporter MnhC subunit
MSLIVTLPSSNSSVSSLTSTTSSAFALSAILVGSAIAICVLILVLAFYDVASRGNSRNGDATAQNGNTTAALRAICVPLIVTFCAWFLFTAARSWPSSSSVSSFTSTIPSAFALREILVGTAIVECVLIIVLAFYYVTSGATRGTEIQRHRGATPGM